MLPCYGPRRVCCCSLGSLQPAHTWIWPHSPRQQHLCTGVPGRCGAGFRPGLSALQLRGPLASLAHPTSGALYCTWPSSAQPELTPAVCHTREPLRRSRACCPLGACLRAGGGSVGFQGGLCAPTPSSSITGGAAAAAAWGPGRGRAGAGAGADTRPGPLVAARLWQVCVGGLRSPSCRGQIALRTCQRCHRGRNPELVVQPRPIISAHSRSRGRGGGLPRKAGEILPIFFFLFYFIRAAWVLGPGFTGRSS